MLSFVLIHPTVWLQHTNVTDRQDRTRQTDRQWSDSVQRTVLRTAGSPKNQTILAQVTAEMSEMRLAVEGSAKTEPLASVRFKKASLYFGRKFAKCGLIFYPHDAVLARYMLWQPGVCHKPVFFRGRLMSSKRAAIGYVRCLSCCGGDIW